MQEIKNHQVWTRWEHGGEVVTFQEHLGDTRTRYTGFQFRGREYSSARKLLMEIHGGRDNHLTVDRYFGLSRDPQPVTIVEMFAKPPIMAKVSKGPVIVVEKRLGIDFQVLKDDVRRLFYSGFGAEVVQRGFDPEDVFQEVCMGLEIRNRGTCPFDKDTATLSTYVFMVARCILSNYTRKSKSDRTMLGGFFDQDGNECDLSHLDRWGESSPWVDQAGWSMIRNESSFEELRIRRAEISQVIRMKVSPEFFDLADTVLSGLLLGYSQNEITTLLGISKEKVKNAIQFLRQELHDFFPRVQTKSPTKKSELEDPLSDSPCEPEEDLIEKARKNATRKKIALSRTDTKDLPSGSEENLIEDFLRKNKALVFPTVPANP